MRRRGLTVPELLVTMGLLGLMLTVALGTFTAYSRAYKSLANERPDSTRSGQAMLRLSQALRSGRLTSPSPGELERGFAPRPDRPLVVEHPTRGQLSFWWAPSGQIEENSRPIGDADGWSVRLQRDLLTLSFPGKRPLQTVVRVKVDP